MHAYLMYFRRYNQIYVNTLDIGWKLVHYSCYIKMDIPRGGCADILSKNEYIKIEHVIVTEFVSLKASYSVLAWHIFFVLISGYA